MDESKGCLPCQAWEEKTKSLMAASQRRQGVACQQPLRLEFWALDMFNKDWEKNGLKVTLVCFYVDACKAALAMEHSHLTHCYE